MKCFERYFKIFKGNILVEDVFIICNFLSLINDVVEILYIIIFKYVGL